ncbi:MAG: protein kinase [Phycisphaerales bacterium]
MAADPAPSAHSIFVRAARLPVAARAAFLDAECGSDAALRRRVGMLLAARDAAAGFSPSLAADAARQVHDDAIAPPIPADAPAPADADRGAVDALRDEGADAGRRDDPATSADLGAAVVDRGRRRRDVPLAEPLGSLLREAPGSRIGPYRLVRSLGSGGFGVVFLAEQERPVRRHVAIKIIKLGMDTRQVIERFDAERQALAIMDHPNIAKVFDAGATETGRPYFVMELVDGAPITQYCDSRRLDLRQRLELFRMVCNAVQHAHQKGVIHRDIKPSNVLVTIVDDEPVPKVIDFGIAKATHARLTERTMVTEANQFIGTPEYMSPEQAGASGLDIDTRTDIYSLGVLLYELLTGTTPLEPLRLRQAGLTELQRIICDEEAPRPSVRAAALGSRMEPIATKRRIAGPKLASSLRGELDWIVLKAIEKDRNRRYDTAVALAADITRYLANRPVEASPPSTSYRIRKFVQRNRRAVIAAGVVAATVAVGVAATGTALVMWLVQVRHSTQVSDFLTGLFGQVNPAQGAGDDAAVQAVFDEARRLFDVDTGVGEQILFSYGEKLRSAGELNAAARMISTALDQLRARGAGGGPEESGALMLLARVGAERGNYNDAVRSAEQALAIIRTARGEDRHYGLALVQLARIHQAFEAPLESFRSLRKAVEVLSRDETALREQLAARCDAAALLVGDLRDSDVLGNDDRTDFLQRTADLATLHLDPGDGRRLVARRANAEHVWRMFGKSQPDRFIAEFDQLRLDAAAAFGTQSVAYAQQLLDLARRCRSFGRDEDAVRFVDAAIAGLRSSTHVEQDGELLADLFSLGSVAHQALGHFEKAAAMKDEQVRAVAAVHGKDSNEALAAIVAAVRAAVPFTTDVAGSIRRVDDVLAVLARPDPRPATSIRREALAVKVSLLERTNDAGAVAAALKESADEIRREKIGRSDSYPVAVCAYARSLAEMTDRPLHLARQDLIDAVGMALRDDRAVDANIEACLRWLIRIPADEVARRLEVRDLLVECCNRKSQATASGGAAGAAELLADVHGWLLRNGFLDDALRIAKAGLAAEGGSPKQRSAGHLRVASTLVAIGNFAEASDSCRSAWRELVDAGLEGALEAADVLIVQATIAVRQGNLAAATTILHRAGDIVNSSGDTFDAAAVEARHRAAVVELDAAHAGAVLPDRAPTK